MTIRCSKCKNLWPLGRSVTIGGFDFCTRCAKVAMKFIWAESTAEFRTELTNLLSKWVAGSPGSG